MYKGHISILASGLLLLSSVGYFPCEVYAQEPSRTDTLTLESPAIEDLILKIPSIDEVGDAQGAQEVGERNGQSHRSKSFFNKLPYLFDDLLLMGGVSRNGLYYTPLYQQVSHSTGWTVGLENYYPIFDRAFLHYGLFYSNRGFEHDLYDVRFHKHYLDIPILLSYELPELEFLDWRLLLGTKLAYMFDSDQHGAYPEGLVNGEDIFIYDPAGFNRWDWGFYVGTSFEKNNFYLRASIFTGLVKVVNQDQGMRSNFSLELGYFLFRGLRSL